MLASENLYYRVMEDIRVKIMDGTYPLNSKIPSEKKITRYLWNKSCNFKKCN